MVRPADMTDTLLRRPFSVFEVRARRRGEPTAITILNKRAGRTTNRLYEAEPGDRIACLGPLGQPYTPVPAPTEAWMVAGGVGLAPFATLAETLAADRRADHAVLRRALRTRSCSTSTSSNSSA